MWSGVLSGKQDQAAAVARPITHCAATRRPMKFSCLCWIGAGIPGWKSSAYDRIQISVSWQDRGIQL